MVQTPSSTTTNLSTDAAIPSLIPPAGTTVLVLLTIGTAIAQSIWGWERLAEAFGIARSHASLTEPLALITYVFPHGGWWHVLPNTTALWVFGATVERSIGMWRFVVGYFTAGIVGAFSYTLVAPNETRPLAGASLALTGILGAYASWRWLK